MFSRICSHLFADLKTDIDLKILSIVILRTGRLCLLLCFEMKFNSAFELQSFLVCNV